MAVIIKTGPRSASNREWAALVEAARLDGDPRAWSELLAGSLDWRRLLTLADQHGILALFSARLADVAEDLIPRSIREELQHRNRGHAIYSLGLIAELFRVLERFQAAKVEVLATKGPALSLRSYGDPSLRQYSDLDFIVRTRDMARITETMVGMGYEPRIPLQAIAAGKFPGEYAFRHRDANLLVEFHTEHTFRYHPRRMQMDKILSRKTCVELNGRQVPALSAEDELVLICIHAAKHLWERLAWICDVAALLTRSPELNWERTPFAASEVGAERMLRIAIQLAAYVLNAPFSEQIIAYANADPGALRVARQIAGQFPDFNSSSLGVLKRAAFRMKMREGFFPGLSYLTRLSLSPTEDDWTSETESKIPLFMDVLARPLRLAKKYRRQNSTSAPQ